ncbi:hypothetical protein PC129_g12873 [Phytophthora cactorum]|uniref:Centrosomal protein of 70 kDa n=1 Tax=Phytophthora cactorum TaxID=29920 RepID=A0A329SE93_9STRA|nr:hypothetical protein Pcac1_g1718 [Phytophthora cactorum]KAG3195429.1 hypothetical protein PC128_g8505 [Phytophthora cactorum]KAG3216263.1 hypothetical protein PC129_g12873 [Phytophthora cactorum]KAG4244552.1 hypothetical protein PC116_g7634 [Phytophthora cactorum]RAW33872.1 hypothetical protein PC110_g9810 [Phytophthora cactorum]
MEEELRELRLELKAARNDVKRYASYALRLQQELTREKQKIVELGKEEDAGFPHLNGKYIEPAESFAWDKKVEKSRTEHGAWSRKIDQVAKMLDEKRGEAVAAKEKDATRDNQVGESVENVIQSLEPFLNQQKRLIGEIGRENAKLRDMLRARPTRRELVTSQLEVERLQRHVQKLRAKAKNPARHEPSKVPQELQPGEGGAGGAKESSLSERITEERLLQMLRVNTKNSATHHKYLKEKLHCYLSLDTASLAKQRELTEAGILERIGRICSDIVASCCYVLEVEEVGELPNCVERARQLSQVSTTYQDFVERIEKLLKRFGKDVFFSTRAEFTADTSCREALQMIVSHVNDVLVELDARREQMKPPGSKAHEVLLASMKLLQVARVDQLTPIIRRLVDNIRAEQEFQRDLRELFGLDESANRKQILHVASVLFGEVGFLHGNAPLRQRSTTSPR